VNLLDWAAGARRVTQGIWPEFKLALAIEKNDVRFKLHVNA
jgi:hypothetical protein